MLIAFKASLLFLWRHPWQLGLAVLGVLTGVAVIVAVDLANESSRVAFLESLASVTGEASHQVIGGPAGLDQELYVELRRQHGMTALAPMIEGDVFVESRSYTLLGVDLFAEGALRQYEFNSEDGGTETDLLFSRFLTEPGSIVVSEDTAAALGLAIGDPLVVRANGRDQPASIVATFADGGTLAGFLLVDISTAQEWLSLGDSLTRIDVRLADDEVAAFEALLPSRARLLDSEGRTRSTLEMSDAFMVNLKAMSLLALLVGLFLIYNSASFSVLQRRHLLGVLRALGVTRTEAFMLIAVEALFLGAAAGALGVLAGIWLGEKLLFFVTQSINDLYFRVAVTSVTVDAVTVTKGLLAGILASLVAASVPALEAASYPPRLAMTRSTLEHGARRVVPWIAVAGIALLLMAVAVLELSETSLVLGLIAVFLLIFGVALLIPWLVARLTKLIAPLANRLAGVPARLAVTGIGTSLSRTGVAIVALAVAVSATIGVSVMVDSFRGSVSQWLDETLQADIYFGLPSGGLDHDFVRNAALLEGVEAYSTTRRALFVADEEQTRVIAIRMAPDSYAGTEILDAEAAEVWPRWEREDVVFVSEPYAYRNDRGLGDTVTLPTDTGSVTFDIIATFQSYDVNGSGVLMSRGTYDRHWTDDAIDSVGLYLSNDDQAADTINAVESLGEQYGQSVFASSNVAIRKLSLDIFDRTFIITNILYWLAVGVAIVGILGAMLALQLERGRELGLLRALGMTPLELGRNITVQTGTIGILSGLASIPLGIAMAWVLIDVINRRAFGWQIDMDVAPQFVIGGFALSVVSALVAGILPAWQAARTEPALAMREE